MKRPIFRLAVVALVVTTGSDSLSAQQQPDPSAAVREGFREVSTWITKAADLVPADKYTYKPTASVRTVGQLVAHMIDGYNYFCSAGAGKKIEWSDANEKAATDKATLARKLKQATDACSAAYASPKGFPPLMANIAHSNLHYGNLITYMRMLGLTPPSS